MGARGALALRVVSVQRDLRDERRVQDERGSVPEEHDGVARLDQRREDLRGSRPLKKDTKSEEDDVWRFGAREKGTPRCVDDARRAAEHVELERRARELTGVPVYVCTKRPAL